MALVLFVGEMLVMFVIGIGFGVAVVPVIARRMKSGRVIATTEKYVPPDYREVALRMGGGELHPLSNVAVGTLGYALYALEMDGLMAKRSERRRIDPITWIDVTIFEPTEAGKRAMAMLAD